MARKQKNKEGCLLYIGAGRCAELNDFIQSKTKTIVLVDANPEVCNYLRYETRHAKHITVVHAAISSGARSGNFKIYNFEDMSSLHKPTGLMEIYPGLELEKAVAMQTLGFSDLVKTYVPKGSIFDLILDVSGSEGDIVTEVLNGPYFKRVQNFKVWGADIALYEDASPIEKIRGLFKGKGIKTNFIDQENGDFKILSGRIDAALLEKLELENQLSTLLKQKKATQSNLSKLKSEKTDITRRLEVASKDLSQSKKDLASKEQESHDLKSEIKDLSLQLEQSKTTLSQSQKELETSSEALSRAKEALSASEKEKQNLTAEVSRLEASLETLEAKNSKSIEYQSQFSGRNKYLTKRVTQLEKELTIAQSVDQDAMTTLKTSMQTTYQSIIDELNHQISTLTEITKSKSKQIDQLVADQKSVKLKTDAVDILSADLKSAQDTIFKLKSKIAEREATLNWHINQAALKETKQQSNKKNEKSKVVVAKQNPPPKDLNAKVILVGSSPRSGGTWVFNVIRGIFETLQLPYSSGWHEEFKPSASAAYYVIKIHDLDKYKGPIWKTITNHRALEKRIASLIRMNWVEETDEGISSALKYQSSLYQTWSDLSDHEVNFELIEANPKKIIRDIAKVLELSLSGDQENKVFNFVDQLKPPAKPPYDPVTLLHPRHRHTNSDLNNERVSRIVKIMNTKK